MTKKIIDCVVCGKRVLPTRWKYGTCDIKCEKNMNDKQKEIIKNIFKKKERPRWQRRPRKN